MLPLYYILQLQYIPTYILYTSPKQYILHYILPIILYTICSPIYAPPHILHYMLPHILSTIYSNTPPYILSTIYSPTLHCILFTIYSTPPLNNPHRTTT